MRLYKKIRRKWRRRRYNKALKLLQTVADRHEADGHIVVLKYTSQSELVYRCVGCPNATP